MSEIPREGTAVLDEAILDSQSGPVKVLGRIIPNLVLIRDTGADYVEFRVQCEVRLTDPAEIAIVEQALKSKDPGDLEKARPVVQKGADAVGSVKGFKDILDIAITVNQNPPPLPQRPGE